MDDLLDIESSSQGQNLPETQEILYDENMYDDNNAWVSFRSEYSEGLPEIRDWKGDDITIQKPKFSPKIETLQEFKYDDQESKRKLETALLFHSQQKAQEESLLLPTKKNEIRDMLMDLF